MRNNVSKPLDRACAARVLPERNMRSRLVIIGGVFRKDSAKVLRVERDQMISALAPDRPDQAFSISVLQGETERGGPVPDAHGSHPSLERAAKCSVIVTDEIFGRRVPRECFGDLAHQPLPLGSGSPQTTPAAAVDGQERELRIAAERQSSEPQRDQSMQSPPHDCEGKSSRSAMASTARTGFPSPILNEADFISVISDARSEYNSGSNDMIKGAARAHRRERLCQMVQSMNVRGWTGRIAKLSSSSSGKGMLAVSIGPQITIGPIKAAPFVCAHVYRGEAQILGPRAAPERKGSRSVYGVGRREVTLRQDGEVDSIRAFNPR
jgi:hypothetical protein